MISQEDTKLGRYFDLINQNENMFYIIQRFRTKKSYRFNELFKATRYVKIDEQPNKGLLSKPTYSKAISELVDLGLLIKAKSKKHKQAYEYSLSDDFDKELDDFFNSTTLLSDDENKELLKVMKSSNPRAVTIFTSTIIMEEVLRALKYAFTAPENQFERFNALKYFLLNIGSALSLLDNKKRSEYAETLSELRSKWIDFLETEYSKELTELQKTSDDILRTK